MEPQKRFFNKKILLISFCILVLILASGYIGYFFAKKSIQPRVIVRTINKPEPTVTITPPKGQFLTYNSQKLGISFNYYEYANGDAIKIPLKVAETGNKIFLYVNYSKDKPDDPTSGKYVEILSKNPNQSLEEAVFQNILGGNVEKKTKCKIFNYTNTLHPNYEYLRLNIPASDDPNTDYNDALASAKACDFVHTNWNGVRYFLMDKGHPDKYLFILISQDNFAFPYTDSSDVPFTWDDTIGFIK